MAWDKLNCDELRNLLRGYGQPSDGRKRELINRLVACAVWRGWRFSGLPIWRFLAPESAT